MIGAFIERFLLSEVDFCHSVLFFLGQCSKTSLLYSSAHCCGEPATSLQRLAQLKAACKTLGDSSTGPAQALVSLDTLTSDMGSKFPRWDLNPAHPGSAATAGYAFLVSVENITALYGLARCQCEAPFHLEEAQRLRQCAPIVWGALNDCLSLMEINAPPSSSPPFASDTNLKCCDQIAEPSATLTNVLDDFIQSPDTGLSPKEAAIARHSLRGDSAKTIATALSISPHTVNIHMRNIYRKFHVKNRTHLHSAYTDFLMASKRPGGSTSSNLYTRTGPEIEA